MKNIFNKLLILGGMAILVSCTEEDGDTRPVEVTPKLGTATVNMIMAVTTADDMGIDGVDIWIDETRQGQNMRPGDVATVQHEFPQGTIFRSVHGGAAPRYLDNPIGDYETVLTFSTAASMLPATHNNGLQGQLKNGGSYTIIDYGFGNLNHDYEHLFMVEDDLSAPSGGNAKIRFVNANAGECWDATCATTFMVNGTDYGTAYWGGDILYGAGASGLTDFTEVAPGSLNIVVMAGGSEFFSGSVSVTAGQIATIVFFGNEGSGAPETRAEPNEFVKLTH